MDVLADVLSVTRLGTTVIAQAELVPPWGLAIDPSAEAAVHVVQRGESWLRLEGADEPLRLGEGDLVLIRSGVGHSVCDSPHTTPRPYAEALATMGERLAALPVERAHETTVILCAKYLFEHEGPHPVVSLLPELVHLPANQVEGQLQLVLELLRGEAIEGGSGSELVVPRLVDSLLVFVVRAWLDGQPTGAGGWFGALRDPAIARALSLIHEQPAESWTVAGLARRVAQSRATFARRFTQLVGEAPVAYLTRWRMCLAAKLLRETNAPLEEVAARVGYQTGAAFSRAFRRSHGTAPGRFRSQMRASPAS